MRYGKKIILDFHLSLPQVKIFYYTTSLPALSKFEIITGPYNSRTDSYSHIPNTYSCLEQVSIYGPCEPYTAHYLTRKYTFSRSL